MTLTFLGFCFRTLQTFSIISEVLKIFQFSSSSWPRMSGITLFIVISVLSQELYRIYILILHGFEGLGFFLCQDHTDSMEDSHQITENYLRKQTSLFVMFIKQRKKRSSKFKAITFLWLLHNLQKLLPLSFIVIIRSLLILFLVHW